MNYTKLKDIKKTYFGYEEIARALDIAPQSARVSANRYVSQGVLLRVKRNIYMLKDRWDALTSEERFAIANIVQVPSYVSFMSALDYYEVTTQVQRNFIESAALKRTKEIGVAGATFNYTRISKALYFGFVREKDFFIATPEKALLDAVYMMSLKRYNLDLSSIDRNKLDMAKIRLIARKYPLKTREDLRQYGYISKA